MSIEALLGHEVWTGTAVVDRSVLARYLEATGGIATDDVPAALLMSLVPLDALLSRIDGHGRRVLANEFQLEQVRSIRVGQPLRLSSRVVDVTHRPGAATSTTFVTCDDEGFDAGTGERLFRARRVLALLSPKGAA